MRWSWAPPLPEVNPVQRARLQAFAGLGREAAVERVYRRSLDGIAGGSYWQQFGSFFDGKGEPEQINAMSHGCSPSRFRQVNVLLTD